MKHLIYICIGVLFLGLNACEDKEESSVLVFLTPSDIILEKNSDDLVLIKLEAISNVGNLSRLIIDQTDDQTGITTLVDSSIVAKRIVYTLEYRVPPYPDSTVTLLTFNVYNESLELTQIAKKILVNKGSKGLTESSGNILYSQASQKPHAYDVVAAKLVFLSDSASFSIDLIDDTNPKGTVDVLSRNWVSKTDYNFVQFNGFDYANATSTSVNDAYKVGSQSSKMVDIQSGNVYLFGRDGVGTGAVQFILVNDDEGTENDSYNFNIKVSK